MLSGTFGAKNAEKHSKGHSEAGVQKHSKSTPWGTFRPGVSTANLKIQGEAKKRIKKTPNSGAILGGHFCCKIWENDIMSKLH